MKTALDTKFLVSVGRKAEGERWVRYLKCLERLNQMDSIERHKNDKELAVEHPYWRGDKEARDRALAIFEAQLRLLERIWPERFRAGKERMEAEGTQ
jgi:hypothetical protein